MENQGKRTNQNNDSLFFFELGFWAIVAIVILLIMFSSPAEAKRPFSPEKRTYKTTSYKKHRPVRKHAFVCTKNRKINRKGLIR